MNSLLKNIIEKSATVILIYAGKRLIDKGIIWWDERKKKKEAIPADHTAEKSDKTIIPVSMKEIIERNKGQSAASLPRGLFAPGELHVICAQTGMGKSIFAVETNPAGRYLHRILWRIWEKPGNTFHDSEREWTVGNGYL